MKLLPWKLPPSPASPLYAEILALIRAEYVKNPKKAMAWFRAIAESDFWFWQKYVMPLGGQDPYSAEPTKSGYRIQDPHHKRRGGLIVDEPWLFDRMREVQDDFETGRSDVLYMFFRGGFKTTAIVQGGSLWFLARDAMETIAIFTHKVEQVGESMGGVILSQVKNNEILRRHWPQFRNAPKLSDTLLTVARGEGPKEPSISIHPILGSAASGHYSKIFVDDAVTDRIAQSPADLQRVENALSYLQPLRKDATQFFYVATPYPTITGYDPIYKRYLGKKFFSLVRFQPAILPGNIPQLFSLRHFKAAMAKMEDQFAESQYMLRIVPKGGAYFRREWLRHYRFSAEQAAIGARIVILVDMASGNSDDFSIARVVALTHDKKRRNLDLWREKVGLTGMSDLLFGAMPGDEALPENAWIPRGGLVAKWLEHDPDLRVMVEEVGATGYAETFRREIAHRKRELGGRAPSCQIESLTSRRKKENRISKLQPDYRQGLIEYPVNGFGHGSVGDDRDTFEQFVEDEYKGWTLAGDTLNDDMLDTEAWLAQPEVFVSYPSLEVDTEPAYFRRTLFPVASPEGSGSFEEASWRVC